MQGFQRVLIFMPNWLGDVVMATPLVRALREALPRARVDLLVAPGGAKVLEGLPYADEVIVWDRSGRHKGLGGMWRLGGELRRRRYDVAVCCPNSVRSTLVLRLARVPRRVGWSYGGRGVLLTDRLVPQMDGHRRVPRPMPEYYLDLARHLGAEVLSADVELAPTEAGEEEAGAFLARHRAENDSLVGLNVGASFGPSKHWRADRFAETARGLARARGLRPVVLCGPGEEELGREVEDAVIAAGGADVIRTSDDMLSIAGLKSVVMRLALMVTTDTGPRHFAIAFDVPTVCVMGSTNPRMTDQPTARAEVVRLDPLLECMPCHVKVCPLHHQRCLQDLAAAPVLAAAERVLALPPRERAGPPPRRLST